MSLLKIISIIVISGIVLFGIMLYFALSPTIRNVSNKPSLTAFLNKPLNTKRKSRVYFCEAAEYRFIEYSLREEEEYPCKKRYEIPEGTLIQIHKFKTYKSPVSGFTHLYALGEITLPEGNKLEVEYDWGSTDLAQLSGKTPRLRHALWQDTDEPLIVWRE